MSRCFLLFRLQTKVESMYLKVALISCTNVSSLHVIIYGNKAMIPPRRTPETEMAFPNARVVNSLACCYQFQSFPNGGASYFLAIPNPFLIMACCVHSRSTCTCPSDGHASSGVREAFLASWTKHRYVAGSAKPNLVGAAFRCAHCKGRIARGK